TKFLKSKGWSVIRSQGKHDVWGSPDKKQTFALPRHTEASPGIVRKISKIFPDIPQSWR
ncbi:type II toxin-antitoxin system HicA family toxin, partial [Glutamicibacter bergerei]